MERREERDGAISDAAKRRGSECPTKEEVMYSAYQLSNSNILWLIPEPSVYGTQPKLLSYRYKD